MFGDWETNRASFDKLRMRVFPNATKVFPHPELVEGRKLLMQCKNLYTRSDHPS
jgi:hypothetical protein